nr:two-component regulator propeller domain-containing protein [Duganella sp. BJB1802]
MTLAAIGAGRLWPVSAPASTHLRRHRAGQRLAARRGRAAGRLPSRRCWRAATARCGWRPPGLYRADRDTRQRAPRRRGWTRTVRAGRRQLCRARHQHRRPVAGAARAARRIGPLRHVEGLSALDVTVLRDGPGATLWVGTTAGLNRVERASGAVLERLRADPANPAALSHDYVSALYTDRRGRLWVGNGAGIDVMAAQAGGGWRRVRRLDMAHGMPDTNINSLLEDGQGRVWASTDSAIVVIDPASFAVSVLGRADGVRYAPYWMGSGVAVGGELAFGGTGGVTVVRPERYQPWRWTPPVVVTEVRLAQWRRRAATMARRRPRCWCGPRPTASRWASPRWTSRRPN